MKSKTIKIEERKDQIIIIKEIIVEKGRLLYADIDNKGLVNNKGLRQYWEEDSKFNLRSKNSLTRKYELKEDVTYSYSYTVKKY